MHLNMEDCRGEVYPTGRIVFLGPAWQAEWLAKWPGSKPPEANYIGHTPTDLIIRSGIL